MFGPDENEIDELLSRDHNALENLREEEIYLLHKPVRESLELFAKKRSQNLVGVSNPCQLRYIHYLYDICWRIRPFYDHSIEPTLIYVGPSLSSLGISFLLLEIDMLMVSSFSPPPLSDHHCNTLFFLFFFLKDR